MTDRPETRGIYTAHLGGGGGGAGAEWWADVGGAGGVSKDRSW